MRVRTTTSFVSPQGRHSEGDVFELPEGVDWVDVGLCEPVEDATPVQERLEREVLQECTVDELREMATKADVTGRYAMKKSELIDALL